MHKGVTMEGKDKSLAQLIVEAANSQCKDCDGKGWTPPTYAHMSCKGCGGTGKTHSHASKS